MVITRTDGEANKLNRVVVPVCCHSSLSFDCAISPLTIHHCLPLAFVGPFMATETAIFLPQEYI